MGIKIESEDGRVSITADDSSTVKNIYVNGEEVSGTPSSWFERWWLSVLVVVVVVAMTAHYACSR